MNEQELATAVCQEMPDHRLHPEQLIPRQRAAVAGDVLRRQIFLHLPRERRKSCADWCSDPNAECPPYIPDFVKLAESYGIEGIRVTERGQIDSAFEQGEKEHKSARR